MERTDKSDKLMILFILVSLFLLNDFLFIHARRYLTWLLIDYLTRIAAIGIILFVIKNEISVSEDFGIRKIVLKQLIVWTVALSIAGILIDQIGWRFFEKILPDTKIISYPKIKSPFLNIFDLIFGITLISVSEELIFRGYFYTVVKNYVKSAAVIIPLSAVVFGLIHWSSGLHAIVTTALWGILPMVVMWRTRSVVPAIIAHYLTDFAAFSRLIPDNWFSFIK